MSFNEPLPKGEALTGMAVGKHRAEGDRNTETLEVSRELGRRILHVAKQSPHQILCFRLDFAGSLRMSMIMPNASRAAISAVIIASLGAIAAAATAPAATAPAAAAPAAAAPAALPSEATLRDGGALDFEALRAAKWIQGEAPAGFEPGHVYLIDCWATWCSPVVTTIPRLNRLHEKFAGRGLRVIGMSVWEGGHEKVSRFVQGMGKDMRYPVAMAGRGSAFEKTWLDAAKIRGIPRTFIIKDGKLVSTAHPSLITESVVEALLSGGDDGLKVIAEINAAAAKQSQASTLVGQIRQAAAKGDAATAKSQLTQLEALDPHHTALPSLRLDQLVAAKDWAAATQAVTAMPADDDRRIALILLTNKIVLDPAAGFPPEFILAVSRAYATLNPKGPSNAFECVTLARLQWLGNDRDAAIATAKAAEAMAADANLSRSVPPAPFARFTQSLRAGTLPHAREFANWVHQAMPKEQPARPSTAPAKSPLPPTK